MPVICNVICHNVCLQYCGLPAALAKSLVLHNSSYAGIQVIYGVVYPAPTTKQRLVCDQWRKR